MPELLPGYAVSQFSYQVIFSNADSKWCEKAPWVTVQRSKRLLEIKAFSACTEAFGLQLGEISLAGQSTLLHLSTWKIWVNKFYPSLGTLKKSKDKWKLSGKSMLEVLLECWAGSFAFLKTSSRTSSNVTSRPNHWECLKLSTNFNETEECKECSKGVGRHSLVATSWMLWLYQCSMLSSPDFLNEATFHTNTDY